MDNRPIGLLDSGVGGLTVVRQLFYQLPNEEVVYIGDTARMPYGPRSEEEILQFTWEMTRFLLGKNVKMIVFACNTATAIALKTIRESVNIPVIGVISAGANAAVEKSKGERIGVIGTQATINSGSYAKAIQVKNPRLKVESLACPAFVTLVESGNFENEQSQALVRETLAPLIGKVDSLILGCTHYPLLAPQIQQAIGENVLLIDPAAETVRDVSALLNYFDSAADYHEKTTQQFYTTGNAQDFKRIAEKWLQGKISVDSIRIEQKKILIATKNPGKIHEFQKAFNRIGYRVESLLNHPELPEIEETGKTFEENARLKAETIAKLTGKVVLADDSGLCVDLLGGLPGIWSHRFAGPDPTDAENNVKLLHELHSTELMPERRSAHFHTTLVVASPDKESLVIEADWPGHIAVKPKGKDGFGYDPLFLIGDSEKSAAELTTEEKNKISHRGQALKKLFQQFPDWLQK